MYHLLTNVTFSPSLSVSKTCMKGFWHGCLTSCTTHKAFWNFAFSLYESAIPKTHCEKRFYKRELATIYYLLLMKEPELINYMLVIWKLENSWWLSFCFKSKMLVQQVIYKALFKLDVNHNLKSRKCILLSWRYWLNPIFWRYSLK